MSSNREQRTKLWRRNPRCYYCGIHTVNINRAGNGKSKAFRDDEATLEHLHSRLNPERGQHRGKRTHVIACRKCNLAKAREEAAALGIEELRRRSQSGRAARPAECHAP